MRASLVTLMIVLIALPSYAKYSGGRGLPGDPYQIATAEDLILFGETPEDYNKHFILTADIDLDPNLPGRRTFDRAVIAPSDSAHSLEDSMFNGVFDGNDHTILHLTIEGSVYLGLFGCLGSEARILNLKLEGVDINGIFGYVGGLAGLNRGSITTSYSSGAVNGYRCIGGLVGHNSMGSITCSYSTGMISGDERVGGLVGWNQGSITNSYSTGSVIGYELIGGLVGYNIGGGDFGYGIITACYSGGVVKGDSDVGGLVGSCGWMWGDGITASFWDMEASGQAASAAGTGLTTAEMTMASTFLDAGWDFVDETSNGTCDYWEILPNDYPRLSYHLGNRPAMPEGTGTSEEPYLIRDARDLGTIWLEPMAYYRLEKSVDLSGITWPVAVVPWFGGTFDGNAHVIRNLHIEGGGRLGLFGQLVSGATVSNLGLEAVDVSGTGKCVGGIAGESKFTCSIATSYSNGVVDGDESVGGLVGSNRDESSITSSYSTGSVRGNWFVGGLVGVNSEQSSVTTSYSSCMTTGNSNVGGLAGGNFHGSVTMTYSKGRVTGEDSTGGLVGHNVGSITSSYSNAAVNGTDNVGGLVGYNDRGSVAGSYSTGKVSGNEDFGGLVGRNSRHDIDINNITSSVWDIETSGTNISDGGIGLSSAEMVDSNILGLNGFANDPNWVLDSGGDYPRLAWEGTPGLTIPEPTIDWLTGEGTSEAPYCIDTADQLIIFSKASVLWDKHFILDTDIDMDPNLPGRYVFGQSVAQYFTGVFDGNAHTISHLTIKGKGYLGLFGQLGLTADVFDLGLEAIDIFGSGDNVGGLVGCNSGRITTSYCTGTVKGNTWVGGLAGHNGGAESESPLAIAGIIITSYSQAAVSGVSGVGGLVGRNLGGGIITCYSTGKVDGEQFVGGLVGSDSAGGYLSSCFWDIEASGQTTSAAGTGKTTAEMQTAGTFLDAGWDFVDEVANGTGDIWWILEGRDYPRLWWEMVAEN